MHYHCFIVDDEPSIAQTTSEYFNLFGVTCTYALSYQECLDFFQENSASLLLLDINLNEESGFSLCKILREKIDIPIFFISARTSDDDILTALNIGGDDYIKKPYTLNILLAKVKATLKRYNHCDSKNILEIKNILIDCNAYKVTVDGKPIKLKDMEYKLLLYLINNKNRVISKDELLKNVWKDTFIGEGTISVHIRHLREKLEENPDHPILIKTIWGTGYLFEV